MSEFRLYGCACVQSGTSDDETDRQARGCFEQEIGYRGQTGPNRIQSWPRVGPTACQAVGPALTTAVGGQQELTTHLQGMRLR